MLIPFNAEKHTVLIADLHYKILSWSTNALLGKKHIFKIYQGLASLPSTFGFVWMQEDQLIGFALGSTNYLEARNKITSLFTFTDMLKILMNSFSNPRNVINAFDNMFLIPSYLKKCHARAEWLAWITDISHCKARVAAIQTFFALKKYYAENGYSHFSAFVDKRSRESNAFLEGIKEARKKEFIQNNIYILPS